MAVRVLELSKLTSIDLMGHKLLQIFAHYEETALEMKERNEMMEIPIMGMGALFPIVKKKHMIHHITELEHPMINLINALTEVMGSNMGQRNEMMETD